MFWSSAVQNLHIDGRRKRVQTPIGKRSLAGTRLDSDGFRPSLRRAVAFIADKTAKLFEKNDTWNIFPETFYSLNGLGVFDIENDFLPYLSTIDLSEEF